MFKKELLFCGEYELTCKVKSGYVHVYAVNVNDSADCYDLTIGQGNEKISAWNVSLAPAVTCSRAACESCHIGRDLETGEMTVECYACTLYRQYPSVRRAWDSNTNLALFDTDLFFSMVNVALDKIVTLKAYKEGNHDFRIHVAGDFFKVEYLKGWIDIIADHKEFNFFAYSKFYETIGSYCAAYGTEKPKNFCLLGSESHGNKVPAELQQLGIFDKYFVCMDHDHGHGLANKVTFICPGTAAGCNKCGNKCNYAGKGPVYIGCAAHGLKRKELQITNAIIRAVKAVKE